MSCRLGRFCRWWCWGRCISSTLRFLCTAQFSCWQQSRVRGCFRGCFFRTLQIGSRLARWLVPWAGGCSSRFSWRFDIDAYKRWRLVRGMAWKWAGAGWPSCSWFGSRPGIAWAFLVTADTCHTRRRTWVCTFRRLRYWIVTSDLFFLVAGLVQVVGGFLVARLLWKAVCNAAGEGLGYLGGEGSAFEHDWLLPIDLIM